jgi:predicted molibdopterin-dependent oxidoreductase YjgC
MRTRPRLARSVPRSHLGRGAGPGRRHAARPARHARPQGLAGFGSAKGSNEEAYLFQKLVRTGFGSNNVDHCTRLCHASSVAALLEGVGSGAVSNPVRDVEHAELIFVIGSNPTANHPVAATWMKNAAQRGARIVLADPRAPTWRATPGAPCSSRPTPTWPCSTRCCT